jgi:hypothetical protein
MILFQCTIQNEAKIVYQREVKSSVSAKKEEDKDKWLFCQLLRIDTVRSKYSIRTSYRTIDLNDLYLHYANLETSNTVDVPLQSIV